MTLQEALKKVGHEDWERKVEGIKAIEKMAQTHPGAISQDLHTVCVAVVAEVYICILRNHSMTFTFICRHATYAPQCRVRQSHVSA
jgi:hypothetical protein